jgi:hypothetical protein
MFKFGEEWKEEHKPGSPNSPQVPNGEQRKKEEFRAPPWANPGVLIGSVVALVLMFLFVYGQSGDQKTGGSAHSIIFVFEGFKGTVFDRVVMNSNKAPNLRKLLSTKGTQNAACLTVSDERCALAQSGARLGDSFRWASAPGLASILSGVDADKHQVNNDSFSAMAKYMDSSKTYPSFLQTASRAGLRVALFGSSHFLTAADPSTGICNQYGIVDFECANALTSIVMKCVDQTSCNADLRLSLSTPSQGNLMYDRGIDLLTPVFQDQGADIVVIHIPQLAIVGSSTGDFSENSPEYVASIYLVDAFVGQVLALLNSRIDRVHETWLVMGTSDHGGYASSYGTTPKEDEVVPFFVTPLVSGGALMLNPLTLPTRQFDIAPTVLMWHGLLTDDMKSNLDGVPQAICSGGKIPVSCGDVVPTPAPQQKS